MSKWLRIGKVRPHGLRGELSVLLFPKESPWLKSLKQFALAAGDEGPHQVMTVESARAQKDGLIIKAREIADRTAAEKLPLFFYVSSDLLVSHAGEPIYLREVLGFEVQTSSGVVGKITDISSNGPQDLLVVDRAGQAVEIPFVEAFLERIDFEARVVWMNLPEGLWED